MDSFYFIKENTQQFVSVRYFQRNRLQSGAEGQRHSGTGRVKLCVKMNLHQNELCYICVHFNMLTSVQLQSKSYSLMAKKTLTGCIVGKQGLKD